MILAHWTYTRAEWKAFQQWKNNRNNLISRLLRLLKPAGTPAPEVKITPERICVGNKKHYLGESGTGLKQVDIHEARDFYIMAIQYKLPGKKPFMDVNIPIPRGRLREAIQVLAVLQEGIRLR